MFQRSLYKMKTSLFFLLLSSSSIPNQSAAVCYCLQVTSNHRVSQLLLQYPIVAQRRRESRRTSFLIRQPVYLSHRRSSYSWMCVRRPSRVICICIEFNPSIPDITRLYHRKYQLLYIHHKKNNKRINRYIARTH